MEVTRHLILRGDSREMRRVERESVDLVVTSPPYPMIQMWDTLFSGMNSKVARALSRGDGERAFELMHDELDVVWKRTCYVLREGGIACIVIGDATRKLGGAFRLYQNHARVVSSFVTRGLQPLPGIMWVKQSNKPNKFLGSGMLPPSAYPTLEHEHILLFRKGSNRTFSTAADKQRRRRSAYFWEERNRWFSDLWVDIKGERQRIGGEQMSRRSASFPIEIARRLVCMFSIQGDTVLDPFLGRGTTAVSAACCGRNSIGIEIDGILRGVSARRLSCSVKECSTYSARRLENHLEYVARRRKAGNELRYVSRKYGFPVTTSQETDIEVPVLAAVAESHEDCLEASYS